MLHYKTFSEKELGAEFLEQTWFKQILSDCFLTVYRKAISVRRTKGVKPGWLKVPSVKEWGQICKRKEV